MAAATDPLGPLLHIGRRSKLFDGIELAGQVLKPEEDVDLPVAVDAYRRRFPAALAFGKRVMLAARRVGAISVAQRACER